MKGNEDRVTALEECVSSCSIMKEWDAGYKYDKKSLEDKEPVAITTPMP